jgi:hypothetical protein
MFAPLQSWHLNSMKALVPTCILTFTQIFSIIYLILIKYSVACLFTVFSSENFTNIAWDSAGVTTGPVTVPFVLSLGIGFSKAKNAQEGFGILTCASVAPIITVLLVDLLRRLIQSAVTAHTQRKLKRMKSKQSQTDSIEGLELLLAPDGKARCEDLLEHQEETGIVSRVEQLQAEVVRLKAALAQSEREVKRLSESEGQPAETVASTDQVNMVDSEICEEHGYA